MKDCISIKFGKGKSDFQGVKAKGDNAAGLEIWGMTKVRISFVLLW